jgi:hypothetical protein
MLLVQLFGVVQAIGQNAGTVEVPRTPTPSTQNWE